MKNKRSVLQIFTLVMLLALSVMVFGGFANSVDSSDKVAFFGNIEVPADMMVDGSAVAIFGNVTIDGSVREDVVAVFGNVTVNGTVDGDVVSVLGTSKISDKAIVRGDAVGVGGGVVRVPGSIVRGEIADVGFMHNRSEAFAGLMYALLIIMLVLFGVSCITIVLMPDRINAMTNECFSNMVRRFALGLVAFILFFPIIGLLAITIIGIPLILVFIFGFIAIGFMSSIAMSIAVGRKIAGSLSGNKNATYLHLLIGMVVLFAVAMVPILGWLAYIAVMIIAMGVAVDTRLGSGILRK